MARAARGEYTIHENKARGRFEVRVTETDLRTGRTTRRYLTAKTRQGVREKHKDFQRAQDEGRTVDSGKATVADWAAVWLDELLPGTVAPGTLTNYRDVLRLYVLPHVGSKTLEKLTPADVSRMLRSFPCRFPGTAGPAGGVSLGSAGSGAPRVEAGRPCRVRGYQRMTNASGRQAPG